MSFLKTSIRHIQSVLRLSFSLARVNFKLRNEGSYLGFFWYILNPLALFIIILFVKKEAYLGGVIEYYPVYLLSGLLMFNMCVQIVNASITSISANSGFIKSIKIETEALVFSKVIQFVFSHVLEVILLGVCMAYVGFSFVEIGIGILCYIPVLILFLLFLTGIACIASTIGVYVSDFVNVWAVISQLLFFITPIFYLPKEGSLLHEVNQFNPLYYFIKLGREALIGVGGRMDLIASSQIWYFSFLTGEFIIVGLCSVLMFLVGVFVFRKYKYRFAELI